AKQPDIWGQARLTKHRQEYEEQMAAQLGNFQVTLNGALARSDQAYLADAFALGAAVSSQGSGGGTKPPTIDVNTANQLVPNITPAVTDPTKASTAAAPANVFQTPPLGLLATGPGQLFGASTPLFAPGTNNSVLSLEPTEMLDQRSRYLNHLQ